MTADSLMQRYFIYFAYDGLRYHGWQQQPNAPSVQQTLQQALSTLLRQHVEVVGAGRTDAGVHARQMVAHFDVPEELDASQLVYRLNRLLPTDISIADVLPVANDMHARFSARSRTYHYYLHTQKSPFLHRYSCYLTYPLDFDLMNQAAAYLLTVSDFAAFCKSHTDVKTTLCHVTEAQWVQDSPNEWHFVITANRFLRNMVRAVVGTLIDVGRGRITYGDFVHIVSTQKRTEAGESMPAHALFLEKIEYLSNSQSRV